MKKVNIVYKKHRIIWSNTKRVYHIKDLNNIPLGFELKINEAKRFVDKLIDKKEN